jgi:hypothetical protein
MLPTYSTLITPKVNVTGCTKKSYTWHYMSNINFEGVSE